MKIQDSISLKKKKKLNQIYKIKKRNYFMIRLQMKWKFNKALQKSIKFKFRIQNTELNNYSYYKTKRKPLVQIKSLIMKKSFIKKKKKLKKEFLNSQTLIQKRQYSLRIKNTNLVKLKELDN